MFTAEVDFTSNQSITISLNSLADATSATSSTIDNSTNRFIAADIQITVVTDTGATTLGSVTVYLLRSADGGTTFDSVADGNAEILGIFNANAASTTYTFSMDTTRLGILPSHWRVVVLNNSGDALAGSDNSATFTGKKFEII